MSTLSRFSSWRRGRSIRSEGICAIPRSASQWAARAACRGRRKARGSEAGPGATMGSAESERSIRSSVVTCRQGLRSAPGQPQHATRRRDARAQATSKPAGLSPHRMGRAGRATCAREPDTEDIGFAARRSSRRRVMQRIEAHGSVHILLCERSSTSMLHSCAARASAAARGARLSRCARSGAVAGVGGECLRDEVADGLHVVARGVEPGEGRQAVDLVRQHHVIVARHAQGLRGQ